jgi:hypothetical protein
MINLLPDSQKELVRKEYKLRVLVVTLIFTLSSVGLAIMLLAPSLIMMLYRSNASEKSARTIVPSQEAQEFSEKLKMAKQVATMLKPETSGKTPTEVITLIVQHKNPEIAITNISYGNENDTLTATVHGKAKARKDLVALKEGLEAESSIASVNLPVSSFAQNTNIEFSLNITLH